MDKNARKLPTQLESGTVTKKIVKNVTLLFFFFFFQVGNAVPPPMAKAIGYEIKKCVIAKTKEEKETLKKSGDEQLKKEAKDAKKEENDSQNGVKEEGNENETKMES